MTRPGGVSHDMPLRRWRRQQGRTQRWVALHCGVSTDAVSKWEQGHRIPTGEALLGLLQLTRLPVAALIRPVWYLEQHPEYLGAWASPPTGRGRPRTSSASS